jgi:DNA-binding MarR family transcriptional regulator
MAHTPVGKTFTDLVLEVFRFNGRLLAAGDRLTKSLRLTSARWQVLGAIEDQARSVAQIARRMGLTRQNVQRLADALEKEGIVAYAPNPGHRRAKLVCLTLRGKKAFKELGRRQEAWANQIASRIHHSELKVALEVIRKLRSALETRQIG